MTGPFPDRPRAEGDAVAEAARPRLWGLAVGLGLVVFGASFSYVPNTALRAVLLLVGSCASLLGVRPLV